MLIEMLKEMLIVGIIIGNVLYFINKSEYSDSAFTILIVILGIPTAIVGWICWMEGEKVDM